MAEVLGTIITTEEGPSISGFSFVIKNEIGVKRGQFIAVKTNEGTAIATVANIFKTNRYFESAGSVHEYNKASDIFTAFPVKEWEYTIADAKMLGTYTVDGDLNRPSFPPSPGTDVTEVEPNMLNKFLGLDQEKGLDLGDVQQHNLKAKFNLTRMIQKHLAVLAISGAGKSYAVSVLIEELLNRTDKQGRIAVIIVDNHGEYASLAEDPDLKNKVNVVNAADIRIATQNVSEKLFSQLIPSMTPVQVRELGKIMYSLKKEGGFDIADVMDAVKLHVGLSEPTSNALLAWLSELKAIDIFSDSDYPNFDDLAKQGQAVILNFRDVLDMRKKQLIVSYISRRLFNLRRKGLVPPYLEIIEEAHNFCPEGAKSENALSRGIIETLASEGRKFYANLCLISQRPVQLSTTALSQCNTQIILRVTNPYDLDHIKKSAEAISASTLDIISGLKTGEALVIGEATNYPVFVKIRKRKSKESHGTKLEDYAILWEKKIGNSKLAEGKEFL